MRWFVILVASAMLVPGVVGQDRPVTSGGWSVHVVRAGESLSSVGARHGVEPRVLAHGNAVRSDAALRVGQRLIIDNRHLVPSAEREDEIVINVPQRMLFHFVGGMLAAAYPVAVGRPSSPTFLGCALIEPGICRARRGEFRSAQ